MKEKAKRKTKDWAFLSYESKRKIISEMVKVNPIEKILDVAKSSAKKNNRLSLRKILTYVSDNTTGSKALSKLVDKNPIPLTPNEALTVYLSCDFTQDTYQFIRNITKLRHSDIFPVYADILNAKRECYPENIEFNELKVEVPVQDLLDASVYRIFQIDEVKIAVQKKADTLLNNLTNDAIKLRYKLYSKYGFDGATGQSKYKQRFEQSPLESSDESLFTSTLVPIFLSDECSNNIWVNPNPASTRFCRPIRFQYLKETSEIIRNEADYLKVQMNDLTQKIIEIKYKNSIIEIEVFYENKLTMLDGKCANAVSNNSSTKVCNICGAKPVEMNNLLVVKSLESDQEALELGLSPLHMWIRCFEFILHLSYRLGFCNWQVRKSNRDHCAMFFEKKRFVQQEFKKKLGLIVDMPKDSGSGTTNDGNTARRAFSNYKIFSEITGISEVLIRRLFVILRVINSTFNINIDKFNDYCLEIYHLYVSQYSWFYMPVSVHKLLIHGAEVASKLLFPIGIFTEEAQEANNKISKQSRLNHSRKKNRILTNIDHFHHLMLTSDPYISNLSCSFGKIRSRKKKEKDLDVEILRLLLVGNEKSTEIADESIISVMEDNSQSESSDDDDDDDDDSFQNEYFMDLEFLDSMEAHIDNDSIQDKYFSNYLLSRNDDELELPEFFFSYENI